MKQNQKKATRRKPSAARQLRAKLARDLAAVINNPECPFTLYNDIGESLCEMSSDIGNDFWHSPEMIERSINAHIAREEERKGGVR